MKIGLVVGGCLVLATLTPILLGCLLPRGHLVSCRVWLRQPADAVFRVITDFRSGPSWKPGLTNVELLPAYDGKPSFREDGKNGSIVLVVEEMVFPSSLVTRIVDQSAFGGTWTFEVEPVADGCNVTITERGEVHNPFFRFMGRFVLGYSGTLNAYLQALARHFGETVAQCA
jgi:hypothetical protein